MHHGFQLRSTSFIRQPTYVTLRPAGGAAHKKRSFNSIRCRSGVCLVGYLFVFLSLR